MEERKSLSRFDKNKPIKISSELYDLEKCRWVMNTHEYRLLFGLAQCVEPNVLFNTQLTIKKDALFSFLGIEKSNKRYDVMRATLEGVREKGLEISSVDKRGKRTWIGLSWINYWKLSESGEFVDIDINERAVPLLVSLKQYALIQPKTYLQLDTDYQNWLYPLLKLRCKLGRWEMSIEDISNALNLSAKDSYNKDKCKNAVMNILRWVVGIEPSERYKEDLKQAKLLRREPQNLAWDYTKDSKGNPTGTLYSITSVTDLNVTACAIKEGRSYSKVIFYISEKPSAQSAKRRAEESYAEEDMGRPQQRGKRMNKTTDMKQLFSQEPVAVEVINPAHIGADLSKAVVKEPIYYTEQEIAELIGSNDKRVIAEMAKQAGYTKQPDGRWMK